MRLNFKGRNSSGSKVGLGSPEEPGRLGVSKCVYGRFGSMPSGCKRCYKRSRSQAFPIRGNLGVFLFFALYIYFHPSVCLVSTFKSPRTYR